MIIGAKIRMTRYERGMTQVDVAKAAGISQTILSRIETGYKNASPRTLQKISEVLSTPLIPLLQNSVSPGIAAYLDTPDMISFFENFQMISVKNQNIIMELVESLRDKGSEV